MAAEVDTVFADVERRTERIIGIVRLVVLLFLAFVLWGVGGSTKSYTGMIPLVGLGTTSVVALAVSGSRLFRPWVLWLLATFDVIFLLHCLAMFAAASGKPLYLALEVPAASVIFVFLAVAAVRHRPSLVLYVGALFGAGWIVLCWLRPPLSESPSLGPRLTPGVARLIMVELVAFALFVGVSRARHAFIKSITEARLRANLSRYFSPQVSGEIARTGNAIRSFQPQNAAVLFADLRGFTALSERAPAADIVEFLNEYRQRAADAINRHHGMIDKFIGDGVMAVFGVPHPSDEDARNAALAGLALVSAVGRWSDMRVAQGLTPVRIGVGIHYGEVVAGALGDDRRLEYTVIGDTVNVAARIEQLTGRRGASLLVSGEVLAAAPSLLNDLGLEELPTSPLRGKSTPTRLYRLRDTSDASWNANQKQTRITSAKV